MITHKPLRLFCAHLALFTVVSCGGRSSLSDSLPRASTEDASISVNVAALTGCESRKTMAFASQFSDLASTNVNRCSDVGFYDSVNHLVGILRAGESLPAVARASSATGHVRVSGDGEHLTFINTNGHASLFERATSLTRELALPVGRFQATGWLSVNEKPHYWTSDVGGESPTLNVYDVVTGARVASLDTGMIPSVENASANWLFFPSDANSELSTLFTSSLNWKVSTIPSDKPTLTRSDQMVTSHWRLPSGAGGWAIALHVLFEHCRGDAFCGRAYNFQAIELRTGKSITKKYNFPYAGTFPQTKLELTQGAMALSLDSKSTWLFAEDGSETTVDGALLDGAEEGGRWLLSRDGASVVVDTHGREIKNLGNVLSNTMSRDGRFVTTTAYAGCTLRGGSCINQYYGLELVNLDDHTVPRPLGWFDGPVVPMWIGNTGTVFVNGDRFVSAPTPTNAPSTERAAFVIGANGSIIKSLDPQQDPNLAAGSDGNALLTGSYRSNMTTIKRFRPDGRDIEVLGRDTTGSKPFIQIAPQNSEGHSNAVVIMPNNDKRTSYRVWTGVPSL